MGEFYTTEEMAEMFKVDQETIRRYLLTQKIKGFKLGKEWRVAEADLKQFIDESSNI